MGGKGFDFEGPSDVMGEIASVVPDYGGISYQRLEEGGLVWPCPTPDHPGTPILYTEGFIPGRGRFAPLEYGPPAELPDEEYPLILTTGSDLYRFRGMGWRVMGLSRMSDDDLVDISPADAAALGLVDDDPVRVIYRRGRVKARVRVTDVTPPGVVYMSSNFSPVAGSALDLSSKTSELKVAAVRIEKRGGKRYNA